MLLAFTFYNIQPFLFPCIRVDQQGWLPQRKSIGHSLVLCAIAGKFRVVYRTYYWESERGAEIDFVIQRDGQLIPVEVKSADNTKAKSLKVYMDTYKPAYAIKLSAKNFGCDGNKKIVPLYAAFCI